MNLTLSLPKSSSGLECGNRSDASGQWPWKVLLCIAVLALPETAPAQSSQCHFQADEDQQCTLNAGGGFTAVTGADGNSLKSGWNFQAGAGLVMIGGDRDARVTWFVNFNFMFDQLQAKHAALVQAAQDNPTNLGLLQANSATAKYYGVSADVLTLRIRPSETFAFYPFAGFGWLRRSVDFSGPSVQGELLQPLGPTVFGQGGDSGAIDGGIGVSYGPKWMGPLKFYGEARFIHGLAINKSTTLIPLSAGIRW